MWWSVFRGGVFFHEIKNVFYFQINVRSISSEHLSIFCVIIQTSNVRNVNPGDVWAAAVRTFTDRDTSNFCRIRMLIDEGYEDRILMAHDVHTKNRLMKYGGHGYSHIFKNIVPKMLIRGISQDKIDKILLANPKRWLTFK